MSDHLEPILFVEALSPVVRQCAAASRIFSGRVPDIGKDADATLTGAKAQDASTVFTAVDSGLQDILLSVVLQQFPGIRCIAEESTALARRFVVRVRPDDMADLKEEVRIAVIRKLMELEQRTEDLDEDDIEEMEVLLGVTPA